MIYQAKKKKGVITFHKTGATITFTDLQVKQDLDKMEKLLKELEAQIKLEEAKLVNVRENHPEVLKIKPEKRVAIAIYARSEGLKKEYEAKLKEVKTAYKELNQELKEIEKQTGYKIK